MALVIFFRQDVKTEVTRKSGGNGLSQDRNGDTREATGFAGFDPKSVEPYVVKNPEALAVNLARTLEQLGKAASAWLAPRERGEKVDTVAEPVVDMVKTLSKVSEYWLSDPRRTLEAQTHLLGSYFGIWSKTLQKLGGEPPEESDDKHGQDKRFADEDWVKNPFFDFLRQAYFVTSD
ncbi:MAG TPA: class I poly(R)-hydroxyalkanoic acid synthase, partial [Mycoplana sp.]|nr:class I poly(R)-hydroxyalkanoic acid synthase [Mycoplana sp.]